MLSFHRATPKTLQAPVDRPTGRATHPLAAPRPEPRRAPRRRSLLRSELERLRRSGPEEDPDRPGSSEPIATRLEAITSRLEARLSGCQSESSESSESSPRLGRKVGVVTEGRSGGFHQVGCESREVRCEHPRPLDGTIYINTPLSDPCRPGYIS